GCLFLGMERGFLNQKVNGEGKGVKENKQGDDGTHSLGNGNALSGMGVVQIVNTVDDVGKDSDTNSSSTKVTPGNSAMNKEGNLHDENDGLTPSKYTANLNKGTSYANLFTGGPSRKAINFRTLFTPARNEVDVDGFFLGKRVAYHVFSTMYGLDASKDGFCDIATKLGTLLMHDSYTSDMCIQSWGRSSYARALIEVQADVELKDNTVVAMHTLIGEGFYTCNVHVEYEWKPLRCACCKVFGHVQYACPKNINSNVVKNIRSLAKLLEVF
ncbi:hypothetical protein Tco_1565747, partial [Tanacetum coccineum]